MDYAEIRRLSLQGFLAFLGLTALIAIVSVLSGEFGEIQGKILVTTITISVASIFSMSCAAFIENKELPRVGLTGISLSVCAAALVIAGVWSDIENDVYWKTAISIGILAFSFAHALLLLLRDLDEGQKWIQTVSWLSIALLAVLIVIAVCAQIERAEYYRILGVVAIVVGLETLAIPLLFAMARARRVSKDKLILDKLREGVYRSADGRIYQVKELDNDPDAEAEESRLPSESGR